LILVCLICALQKLDHRNGRANGKYRSKKTEA
jgi:hypothetical protein